MSRNALVWIAVLTSALLIGVILFDVFNERNDNNFPPNPKYGVDNGMQTPSEPPAGPHDGLIVPDKPLYEGVDKDDLKGAVEAFEEEQMRVGDLGIEQLPGLKAFTVMRKTYPTKGMPYVQTVLDYGRRYLGTPYVYGSSRSDDSSFDCSDFTYWVYGKAIGLKLPKDSRSQREFVAKFGSNQQSPQNWRNAQPGDLFFFGSYRGYRPQNYTGVNKATARVTHVGIYLGNGQLLHTASAPTGVRIQNIANTHLEWRLLFTGRPY